MKTILQFYCCFFVDYLLRKQQLLELLLMIVVNPYQEQTLLVVGTSTGTVTDFDGNFTLNVNSRPPFTLQASSIGFETATEQVTSNNQTINFILKEGNFFR